MKNRTLHISIDKEDILKYKITKDKEKKDRENRSFYNLLACMNKERSYTFNSTIFKQNEKEKSESAEEPEILTAKEQKPVVMFDKKVIKPNKSMNNIKKVMPVIRSRNTNVNNNELIMNKTGTLRTMSVNLNVNVNLNYTQNGSVFNINNYTKRTPLNYVSLMETRHKHYKLHMPVTTKSTALLDKKIISLYKNKIK
jgi:hypothetical protein